MPQTLHPTTRRRTSPETTLATESRPSTFGCRCYSRECRQDIPSVMPATGAPRRKSNQVSRDKPDIMLLSYPLCLYMYSNAEPACRPEPIAPANSRSPGSAITITTQHGSSIGTFPRCTSLALKLDLRRTSHVPCRTRFSRWVTCRAISARRTCRAHSPSSGALEV